MDYGDFDAMLRAILKNIPTLWGIPATYLELKDKRKDAVREAFKNLKNATHATRVHIEAKGYVANPELSKLWTSASTSMMEAKLFGDSSFIYNIAKKGDFWSDPPKWRQEKGSMEIVPKLRDVDDKCDEILNMLLTR